MNTVLVTGAKGFVGEHMVNRLLKNGYSVVGVVNNTTKHQLKSDDYCCVQADLTDKHQVEAIDFKNIDFVIHLAGLASVGPSFDKPEKYITTNTVIELNLYEEAIKQGVRPRFLIVSSANVYDPSNTSPISEEANTGPNTPYGLSKLYQEELAFYYAKRGLECVIARPFNHIGPGQGEGFILPDLTKQVVECEKGLKNSILVGDLSTSRDYTDVRDVVIAYEHLMTEGKSNNIYNICSGQPTTGEEILRELLKLSSVKSKIKKNETFRPSDYPVIYGDNKKIHELTGWHNTYTLGQTISDTLNYWREVL